MKDRFVDDLTKAEAFLKEVQSLLFRAAYTGWMSNDTKAKCTYMLMSANQAISTLTPPDDEKGQKNDR